MKNLLTRLAIGAASSANYGRQLASDLLVGGKSGSTVGSKEIRAVAKKLGIDGKDKKRKIAQKALEDFSRQDFAPLNWLKPNLTEVHFTSLSRQKVIPHNIDVAISETLGAEGAPNDLFLAGVRCSLANFSTLHLVSDLATILGRVDRAGWCTLQEARGKSNRPSFGQDETRVGKQEARSRMQDARHKTQDLRLAKTPVPHHETLRTMVADSMMNGELLGIALFIGCGQLGSKEVALVKKFAQSGILSLFAGCEAALLHPVPCPKGPLKGWLAKTGTDLGERKLSVILDLGSCMEARWVVDLARGVATRLGIASCAVPVLGVVCDKADAKIEVMAHWMMALGMPVYWVRVPSLLGSPEVARIYTETTRNLFGGYSLWEARPEELIEVVRTRSRTAGLTS